MDDTPITPLLLFVLLVYPTTSAGNNIFILISRIFDFWSSSLGGRTRFPRSDADEDDTVVVLHSSFIGCCRWERTSCKKFAAFVVTVFDVVDPGESVLGTTTGDDDEMDAFSVRTDTGTMLRSRSIPYKDFVGEGTLTVVSVKVGYPDNGFASGGILSDRCIVVPTSIRLPWSSIVGTSLITTFFKEDEDDVNLFRKRSIPYTFAGLFTLLPVLFTVEDNNNSVVVPDPSDNCDDDNESEKEFSIIAGKIVVTFVTGICKESLRIRNGSVFSDTEEGSFGTMTDADVVDMVEFDEPDGNDPVLLSSTVRPGTFARIVRNRLMDS